MNDRDANQPGADPSKDLSDQILAQKFPPSEIQQGCGPTNSSGPTATYSSQCTLSPTAASGNYQAGATFYPHMNNQQQQGRFQAGYGAPGAMPPKHTCTLVRSTTQP